MNNATVMTDMLIPTFMPNHLLVAAIATSALKQSSALMYFIARAAAQQHFAINNNLAELTKKFNSFGMVNYTVASAMGIVFCTYIASFPVQVVTALSCCALNMVLAPMAMINIEFRLLNFTTSSLLMRAYIERQEVLTPKDISKLLGIRMKLHFDNDVEDMERLLYISPPVGKLNIRSDCLHEDVLYVCERHTFMLAL
uniref:Protein root UVB sensitive/RUS domain-containing protein n=2 Tax=Lygus hesperus TaxID=30085 RepID=A0A146KN52_LYGHE